MDGEREVMMSTLEAWSWVRTLVQIYLVVVEGPLWAKKKDSDKMGRRGQGSDQTSSALWLGLRLAWLVNYEELLVLTAKKAGCGRKINTHTLACAQVITSKQTSQLQNESFHEASTFWTPYVHALKGERAIINKQNRQIFLTFCEVWRQQICRAGRLGWR